LHVQWAISLLANVRVRVETDYVPDIEILQNGIVIPDGGTTDAFARAVQDAGFPVVFTIVNKSQGVLALRGDPALIEYESNYLVVPKDTSPDLSTETG